MQSDKSTNDLNIARLIKQRDGVLIAAAYMRLRGWSLDAALCWLLRGRISI